MKKGWLISHRQKESPIIAHIFVILFIINFNLTKSKVILGLAIFAWF